MSRWPHDLVAAIGMRRNAWVRQGCVCCSAGLRFAQKWARCHHRAGLECFDPNEHVRRSMKIMKRRDAKSDNVFPVKGGSLDSDMSPPVCNAHDTTRSILAKVRNC